MPGIVVDVLIVVVLIVALIGGLRRGLLAGLGSLVGIVVGGIAAWWLVPVVTPLVPDASWHGWVVFGLIAVLLIGGAVVGGAIGTALRRGADRIKLKGLDRAAGGVANVVVVALALSFVAQSIAVTGMPVIAAAIGSSSVIRTIDTLTPAPVARALAEVRALVTADALPRLGELFEALPEGPAADPVNLDDPQLSAAAQSVALIAGTAYSCGQSMTGSGFVISPDRVVTNAHVVAGVDAPTVELPGRVAQGGRVIYFDPETDLAIIQVDGLDAAPLAVADNLGFGDAGVVQGYPYGGPFTMASASVRSVGTVGVPDIYNDSSNPRDVYALDAPVYPGNSGGPLLNAQGAVVGVVFARADDGSSVGYAMTTTPLNAAVQAAASSSSAVSTGGCIN